MNPEKQDKLQIDNVDSMFQEISEMKGDKALEDKLSKLSPEDLKALRTIINGESSKIDTELKPVRASAMVAGRMDNLFGGGYIDPKSYEKLADLSAKEKKTDNLKQKVTAELGIDGIEGLNFNKEKGIYELSAPKYTFSAINSLRETGYSFARDANGTMKAKKGGKEFIVYFGPQVESIVKGLGGAFDKMASVVEKYKNADMKDIPKQVIDELRSMADGIGKSFNQLGYVNEKGFASIGLMKFIAIIGLLGWGIYGGGWQIILPLLGVYAGYKFLFDGGKDKKGKPKPSLAGKQWENTQDEVGKWVEDPKNAEKVKWGKRAVVGVIVLLAAGLIFKSCSGTSTSDKGTYVPDFNKPTVVDTDDGGAGKDTKKDNPKDNGTSGQEDGGVQKTEGTPVIPSEDSVNTEGATVKPKPKVSPVTPEVPSGNSVNLKDLIDDMPRP